MAKLEIKIETKDLLALMANSTREAAQEGALLDLRKWIKTEFVEKHLKGVADKEAVQAAEAAIKREISAQIEAQFFKRDFSGRIKANEGFTKAVKDSIAAALNDRVAELMRERLDEIAGDGLDAILESAINRAIQDRAERIISTKLAALQKMLESKLELMALNFDANKPADDSPRKLRKAAQ